MPHCQCDALHWWRVALHLETLQPIRVRSLSVLSIGNTPVLVCPCNQAVPPSADPGQLFVIQYFDVNKL